MQLSTAPYLFNIFSKRPRYYNYADDSTIIAHVEGYGLFERVSEAVLRMVQKRLYDL